MDVKSEIRSRFKLAVSMLRFCFVYKTLVWKVTCRRWRGVIAGGELATMILFGYQ